MAWLIENGNTLLAIWGGLVSVASLVVGLTPSTKDDEFLGKVLKFVELFSIFNKK